MAVCRVGLLLAVFAACVSPSPVRSAGTTVPSALGNDLSVTANMRADDVDPDILYVTARITNERSMQAELVIGGCPLTIRVYSDQGGADSLAWASDAPSRTPNVRERGCFDVKDRIRLDPGSSQTVETWLRMSDVSSAHARSRQYRVTVTMRILEPRLITSEIAAGVFRFPNG